MSHSFQVAQDGLRLEVTVFQYDSDIYFTLYRDGIERPLIDFKMLGCSGIRYISDERGEFLEFAPSKVFGDRFSKDFLIPVGLRLSVKPSIQLEFFGHDV